MFDNNYGYVGSDSSGSSLPCSPMRPSFTSQHGAGRWGSRPTGPRVGPGRLDQVVGGRNRTTGVGVPGTPGGESEPPP